MSENVLKLTKPVMIDDQEVNELPYDFESMTARDKLEVGKRFKMDRIPITVEEVDMDYHIYLFAGAVTKANPAIDVTDVLRMPAKDAHKAAELARRFFYLSSEE